MISPRISSRLAKFSLTTCGGNPHIAANVHEPGRGSQVSNGGLPEETPRGEHRGIRCTTLGIRIQTVECFPPHCSHQHCNDDQTH